MPLQRPDELQGPKILLASAARTATHSTGWIENRRYRALLVTVDITAINLTPSVTFTIEGKDHADNAFTILASAAKTGTGRFTLYVAPGATVAANVSANAIVPFEWRLTITHGDTDSMTYSVGYTLVP